jgi:hypothetical protein
MFNVQHSTISPVLPFDIIALIIDNVGENNETNLLKELALVSHSFLQICRKHLFATVELHDIDLTYDIASSKKAFVMLLKSKPDVVKYIRKLTYTIGCDHVQELEFSPDLNFNSEDNLLSPILPNFLRTIPRLNYLKINASLLDWSELNPSLTSAFLHLMHLPSINHIDLLFIHNFPLSSLTPSVNLLRLDICHLSGVSDVDRPEEDGSLKSVDYSEMMPKIREFRTKDSFLLTKKLLYAKMQDGRPAFKFMDLRRLSLSSIWPSDEENIRYLLENAKSLEKLHLSIGYQCLGGFHDILSLCSRTLKVFDLSVSLYSDSVPLTGLWENLEAMAGLNMLEAFSFEVRVNCRHGHGVTEDLVVVSIFRQVEELLVKSGWSALRQVSFKIMPADYGTQLSKALHSLPDKYLSHLPKLKSVAFNFSAVVSTFK